MEKKLLVWYYGEKFFCIAMKIQNISELATNELRNIALGIAEAGLEAIDTEQVIKQHVSFASGILRIKDEEIIPSSVRRLFIVGIGKCSLDAAFALQEILGDFIAGGIVIDVRYREGLKKMVCYTGDHPFPTERNIDATKKIIELLKDVNEHDLVITVVSGGGSTLLCQPNNLTCREESNLVEYLFSCGATIGEINTVRKHLSLARGGNLAKYAYPAKIVSLIFSDVPGDELEIIASGPTVLDTTTIKDAEDVLAKYNVLQNEHFLENNLMETPKSALYFQNVRNILVVSNSVALDAMSKKAEEQGLLPKICTTCLSGSAASVGENIIKDLNDAPPKSVLLFGGETTVATKGEGEGGRNQELALSALREIKDNQLVLSLASDGYDNSGAAGAIADISAKEKADEAGLDIARYLQGHNSYQFFRIINNQIKTGDTGSNVSDLVIAIKA